MNSLWLENYHIMMAGYAYGKKRFEANQRVSHAEQGKPCHLETQRKILSALGLKPSDRNKLFGKR